MNSVWLVVKMPEDTSSLTHELSALEPKIFLDKDSVLKWLWSLESYFQGGMREYSSNSNMSEGAILWMGETSITLTYGSVAWFCEEIEISKWEMIPKN